MIEIPWDSAQKSISVPKIVDFSAFSNIYNFFIHFYLNMIKKNPYFLDLKPLYFIN